LLLWTSYDDTSITVSIFSTKWAVGEQTNQTREPYGPCTRVKTERTRTFVKDGRKVVDYVTAIYQPEEGVQCYGQPNRREDDRPALKDGGKPNAGGTPGNGTPAPPTPAAPPPPTTKPPPTPPQGASSAQTAVR